MDLADFLLARIAEDEAMVNERTRHLSPNGWSYLEQFGGDFGDDERWMIEVPAARVLAECKSKRKIVQEVATSLRAAQGLRGGSGRLAVTYGIERTLRLLALPYADHPDYREEWRP